MISKIGHYRISKIRHYRLPWKCPNFLTTFEDFHVEILKEFLELKRLWTHGEMALTVDIGVGSTNNTLAIKYI